MRSKRRRRYRSHKLLAALIALNVVAALSGATDLGYVSIKSQADRLQASLTSDLQAGQGELERGQQALKQANEKRDATLISQAVADFIAAKADFESAGQKADGSRFLHYLEYVPSVGQLARTRHTAVDSIAAMGAAVSDAGQRLSQLDAEILKPASSGEAGKTLLTVLVQVHTGLASVREDLQIAQQSAAQVDISVVPSGQQAAFVKARASIDSAIAGFAEFERLYPVLVDVFGGNGVRKYLVEQVNSAELRAGGGFIGTYSLLQADNGSLKVIQSGDSYDLANPRPSPGQPGFIHEPTPFRDIHPELSWSFVDTNLFPDFPSSAQMAEQFAGPHIGKIDAVISIDLYAVAKMLELTGPMQVPGYALTMNSSNFVAEAVRLDLSNAYHKSVLSALAGPLMSRVASLPPEQWPALISVLNQMAFQRHLQVYFDNAAAEAEMDRVGWSGRVNPSAFRDYMMQVEDDYQGGKADYFLIRHYTLSLSRDGATLHHTVTIDYTNNYPGYLRDFLVYIATARLYVSSGATTVSDNLTPVTYAFPSPPAGTQVMVGWLPRVYCCGGRGQASFSYDTPWPANDKSGWQIYWQKQPGTDADSFDVTWSYDARHTYQASGQLSQDLVINLASTGLTIGDGQAAQATLPKLGL